MSLKKELKDFVKQYQYDRSCEDLAIRVAKWTADRCAKVAKNHKHSTKWVDDLNNGDDCEVIDCLPNCEGRISEDILELKKELE